ncbi:hypothetical protein RHS01_10588 [Rhizoctonia solani]|uniref:Proteophosphoglycan ppg4 n=1 Tax=Rhizoctonia solani TaxID=456999 RepID=A0A8H7I3L6_9AGAM|nr:hypothetical protein RHS01_10588 [Rhizoctonia solani]
MTQNSYVITSNPDNQSQLEASFGTRARQSNSFGEVTILKKKTVKSSRDELMLWSPAEAGPPKKESRAAGEMRFTELQLGLERSDDHRLQLLLSLSLPWSSVVERRNGGRAKRKQSDLTPPPTSFLHAIELRGLITPLSLSPSSSWLVGGMQADNRLLTNLIKCEKEHHSALLALLVRSHTSLAALSAYASTASPPVAQALRGCIQAFAAADEGLRGYAVALEGWKEELKEVKRVEDELKAVVKDKDILVNRLIKASKQKIPTSSIQAGPSHTSRILTLFIVLFPPHVSTIQLHTHSPRNATHQFEIGPGSERVAGIGNGQAMSGHGDAGHVWRETGEVGLSTLGELSNEDASGTNSMITAPPCFPFDYVPRRVVMFDGRCSMFDVRYSLRFLALSAPPQLPHYNPPRRTFSTHSSGSSSLAPSHSASQQRHSRSQSPFSPAYSHGSRSASPGPGTYHSINGGYQHSHPLPALPERNSWHVEDTPVRRPEPSRRPISLIDPPRAPALHRRPISSHELPPLPDEVRFDIPPPHSIGHDTNEFIPLGRPVSSTDHSGSGDRWADSSSDEGGGEYRVVENEGGVGRTWKMICEDYRGYTAKDQGQGKEKDQADQEDEEVGQSDQPVRRSERGVLGRADDDTVVLAPTPTASARVPEPAPKVISSEPSARAIPSKPSARAIHSDTVPRAVSPRPASPAPASPVVAPRIASPAPRAVSPSPRDAPSAPVPAHRVASPSPVSAPRVASPEPSHIKPTSPVLAPTSTLSAPAPAPASVPQPTMLQIAHAPVPAHELSRPLSPISPVSILRTSSSSAPPGDPRGNDVNPDTFPALRLAAGIQDSSSSLPPSSSSKPIANEVETLSPEGIFQTSQGVAIEEPQAPSTAYNTPRPPPSLLEAAETADSPVPKAASVLGSPKEATPSLLDTPKAPSTVFETPRAPPSVLDTPKAALFSPALHPESVYQTPQAIPSDIPRVPQHETPGMVQPESPRSPKSPKAQLAKPSKPTDVPKSPKAEQTGLITPMATGGSHSKSHMVASASEPLGQDRPRAKSTSKRRTGHSRQTSAVESVRPSVQPRQPSAEERADLAAMLRDSDGSAPHVRFPPPSAPAASPGGTMFVASAPPPRPQPGALYLPSNGGAGGGGRRDRMSDLSSDDDHRPGNLVTVTNVNPRLVAVDNTAPGSPKRNALGRKLTKADKGQTLREQIVPAKAKKAKSRSVDGGGVSRKGSLRSNASDPQGRATLDVARKGAREPASLMAIVEGPGLVLPSELAARRTDSPGPGPRAESPAPGRSHTLAVPAATAVSPATTASPRPVRATSPMPLKSALRNRTPSPLPPRGCPSSSACFGCPPYQRPCSIPTQQHRRILYETGEEDFDSATEGDDDRSDVTASGPSKPTSIPVPASTQVVHSPGAALAAFKDGLQASTSGGSVSTAGPKSANSTRKSVRINPAPPQMSATPTATPGSELDEEPSWTPKEHKASTSSSGAWASRIGEDGKIAAMNRSTRNMSVFEAHWRRARNIWRL